MPVTLRVGDLIKVPLSDDLVAVAQILVRKGPGNLVIATFPAVPASAGEAELKAQIARKPDLVVETMDVLIRNGTWSVIGNAPVSDDVPIPVWVTAVGIDRVPHIQDIYGKIIRVATPQEAQTLRIPRSSSPALVENAIRAANGIGEWLPNYEGMRADWEHSASELLTTEQ